MNDFRKLIPGTKDWIWFWKDHPDLQGQMLEWQKKPRLVLDCNNLCYMAMFTTGDLSWEEKETGVIFGFLRKVFAIAREFKTNMLVFCWDSRKSYRKEFYPEYKANRHLGLTSEEELERKIAFRQFAELRMTVLPALGFRNNFIQTGYEADDLVACAVDSCPECIVVSTDADLLQLLDRSTIFNPRTKKKITESDFTKSWFGLSPTQWTEVKAMAGDGTDNIPGIRGVGELTAAKYLAGLLSEGKIKQKIESGESAEIIERNLKLVDLPYVTSEHSRCGIQVDFQETFDLDTFVGVFEEYEFKSMVSKSYLQGLQRLFDM